METLEQFVGGLNGLLFSDYTVYVLLATGLLFTIWTAFGQYRAATHGAAVIRGKYDDKNDPGAINHFQALSTALSATVGLGNIAGVGLAVALGGPGAVFWMWVIGILGMSLKMTEVTQSMLFRNTDDPDNPHGGPMFVAKTGFGEGSGTLVWVGAIVLALVAVGLATLSFVNGGTVGVVLGVVLLLVGGGLIALAAAGGKVFGYGVGGLFVVTLITSAITGGNMFQAWNVAETSEVYFGMDRTVVGIVLAVIVGAVIIGGIKVIGRVASIIVPFMCVIYLIAAVWVLANNVAVIPEMLWLIVKNGLGIGGAAEPSGAFLGGTFGYALMWGVKRALFSSEAGQGSAPVAHSAARTDEPVREGVVSGLEPLIDTLVVCTVTALVILTSGAFNRPAAASFSTNDQIAVIPAVDEDGAEVANTWTLAAATLPPKTEEARRVDSVGEGEADWEDGNSFFVVVEADEDVNTGRTLRKIAGELKADEAGELVIEWGTLESEQVPTLVPTQAGGVAGVFRDYKGSTLTAHAFDRVTPGLGKYLVSLAVWMFAISTIISWSYYGEQGMVFLTSGLGEATSKLAILGYKLVYCVIIVVTCLPISGWLETDAAIDMWTTLGLGVMLVVNIPLMWVFAPKAMSAYHAYIGRLRRGELDSEPAPVGEKPD